MDSSIVNCVVLDVYLKILISETSQKGQKEYPKGDCASHFKFDD